MKQYNKINNLVGWLAFVIAAFTYCSTIEPTASFWDCPEFITTGYKLEVGEHYECTDECCMYIVLVLEHYSSGKKANMPA